MNRAIVNYQTLLIKCIFNYTFFSESQCTVFQLRAYLYQARDLYASDRSGLSDPYAIVSFSNHSLCSITVEDTLCPVWNQTIFKRNVKLYGSREFIEGYKEIDCITIQLWDKDQYVSTILDKNSKGLHFVNFCE